MVPASQKVEVIFWLQVGRVRTLSGLSDGSGSSSSEIPVELCDYCNRPAQKVICRSCGHLFQGRVRGQCELHPEVIHLMDYTMCPQEDCRSFMVTEVNVAKVTSTNLPRQGPIAPTWTPQSKSPSPVSHVSPCPSPDPMLRSPSPVVSGKGFEVRSPSPVVWGKGIVDKLPMMKPGNRSATSPWRQEASGYTGPTRLF